MQATAQSLLQELLKLTDTSTSLVKQFKSMTPSQLNYKNTEREWSILECIEHLNLYGEFYLPEIEKQISARHSTNASAIFRSGFLGNYFANLMNVNHGKLKKMKSPKDKNPRGSKLSVLVLERFLKQQELLKSLLVNASDVDLTKTKTAISLTPLIRLRLGDTFRFFIYHIERHVLQANRVKNNLDIKAD